MILAAAGIAPLGEKVAGPELATRQDILSRVLVTKWEGSGRVHLYFTQGHILYFGQGNLANK